MPVYAILETEQAFIAELSDIIDLEIDQNRIKIENRHIVPLNLAQIHLSRLPPTINELISLKELNLRGNLLTLLPENLG